jgi:pimeloyl-ACP methyl ester carboxylesterase
LTKYLIENDFPIKIKNIIFVAWATSDSDYEVLWNFNFDKISNKLKQYENKIILYHSRDDFVVPFSDLDYYKEKIPNSEYNIFENRGHFIDETFPELIQKIKMIK